MKASTPCCAARCAVQPRLQPSSALLDPFLRTVSFLLLLLCPTTARLLKASLVQPSRDLPTINGRLQCVEELVNDDELFHSIEEVVAKFPKARAHCTARNPEHDSRVRAQCSCLQQRKLVRAGGIRRNALVC